MELQKKRTRSESQILRIDFRAFTHLESADFSDHRVNDFYDFESEIFYKKNIERRQV